MIQSPYMPDLLGNAPELPKVEQPVVSEEVIEAQEAAEVARVEEERSENVFLEQPETAAPIDTQITTMVEKTAPMTSTAAPTAAAPAVKVKSEAEVQVEKILEDGLGPYYAALPDSAKPKFRQKGEEASNEIGKMVESLQVNLKRVLQVIRDWLLTIPNVNKFFLEQEAKIKTDKIVALIEMKKEEKQKQP